MSKVGKQQLTTDVQTSLVPFVVATGVANAYNVLISGVASYYDGLSFKAKIPVAASAPITINVNGLGVIPVKKDNGNAVSNWKKDGVYTVVFSGGSFQVLGEGGEYGTASPAEVLSGYSIGRENGVENGTIPDHNGKTIITPNIISSPGYIKVVTETGYHRGTLMQIDDADFISANIKVGVNIFGLNGSLVGFTAGNTTIASSASEYDTFNSYKYSNRFTFSIGMTVKVNFSMMSLNGMSVSAQIHVNRVARGSLRTTTSTSYGVYTQDITVLPGDYIELYMGSAGGTCRVKDIILSVNTGITITAI